jgi:putative transposase
MIARGERQATHLDTYLSHLHANTARDLNKSDQTEGRQVWYNFWETRLTYERSYLARLNYVHKNAVKQGS